MWKTTTIFFLRNESCRNKVCFNKIKYIYTHTSCTHICTYNINVYLYIFIQNIYDTKSQKITEQKYFYVDFLVHKKELNLELEYAYIKITEVKTDFQFDTAWVTLKYLPHYVF